jgi:hypothetical protein
MAIGFETGEVKLFYLPTVKLNKSISNMINQLILLILINHK